MIGVGGILHRYCSSCVGGESRREIALLIEIDRRKEIEAIITNF